MQKHIKNCLEYYGIDEQRKLFLKYKHWLKPEALEQYYLVEFLENNNYKYTAIPNSTYTTSFKQKIINKLTGLKPGLCDMMIILKRGSLLFIELKRQRRVLKNGKLGKSPSVVSKEQKEWIRQLNLIPNIQAEICYGYDEARELIEIIERV